MLTRSAFINKTKMKEVNSVLRRNGYFGYSGDSTTANPNGSGSGYVMNLLNSLAPNDRSAQDKILALISKVL